MGGSPEYMDICPMKCILTDDGPDPQGDRSDGRFVRGVCRLGTGRAGRWIGGEGRWSRRWISCSCTPATSSSTSPAGTWSNHWHRPFLCVFRDHSTPTRMNQVSRICIGTRDELNQEECTGLSRHHLKDTRLFIPNGPQLRRKI